MTNPSPNDIETTQREEFRPCRGCGRHFKACVCNRQMVEVLYKLRCPICDHEFRITEPKQQRWIQRCGQCRNSFDVIVVGGSK